MKRACLLLSLTHTLCHAPLSMFVLFFYFFCDVSHVIAVPVARRSPDQPYPHACTCPIHYRTNSLEVLVRNLLLSLATAKTPQKRGHVVIYLSKYFFEWGMGRGRGRGRGKRRAALYWQGEPLPFPMFRETLHSQTLSLSRSSARTGKVGCKWEKTRWK